MMKFSPEIDEKLNSFAMWKVAPNSKLVRLFIF